MTAGHSEESPRRKTREDEVLRDSSTGYKGRNPDSSLLRIPSKNASGLRLPSNPSDVFVRMTVQQVFKCL
jgi:hypothetical protein